MLAVGRILDGFAVGICSAQVPVYITEISPASKRGRLVGFQQWAITWGILIMYFICYASSYINSSAAFRLPWGLQMVPAILLFLGLCVLPESPRWLGKKDRWDDVAAVLTLVHGKGDRNSQPVQRELAEIREVVRFERANADVSYLELFAPKMINRVSIGVFTQVWSQLTGMNVMVSAPCRRPCRREIAVTPTDVFCRRCTTSHMSLPWQDSRSQVRLSRRRSQLELPV